MGPLLCLPWEEPRISCAYVELEEQNAASVAAFVASLGLVDGPYVAAHDGTVRVRELVKLPSAPASTAIPVITRNGCVVITGGLGGMGWKSDFDTAPCPQSELAAMAAAVLEKCGLAHKAEAPSAEDSRAGCKVLDVGSGSGCVAQALAKAVQEYAAVDMARNELSRLASFDAAASVTPYRMEAADIHFLEGQAFDVVVMDGVRPRAEVAP